MTIRCWDFHDQIALAGVAFASSQADAIRLANDHRASFDGYESTLMTAIERCPALLGTAGVHLADAMNARVVGIGHLQKDGSWLVLPPGSWPGSSAQPTPTEMHHFIDKDDYQFVFFARDDFRAGELYDAMCHRDASLPDEWLGSEWDAWTMIGLVRHQRHAENRGVEGIGVYSADGWQILPIDYQEFGVDPPDG